MKLKATLRSSTHVFRKASPLWKYFRKILKFTSFRSIFLKFARMSSSNNVYFPDEEAAGNKLGRKAKESPFMVAGLGGLVVALGIAAYKYRHRGNMTTSMFLMQTRVAAQGTVVGCVTIGLAYQMFNKWVLHNGEDDK